MKTEAIITISLLLFGATALQAQHKPPRVSTLTSPCKDLTRTPEKLPKGTARR